MVRSSKHQQVKWNMSNPKKKDVRCYICSRPATRYLVRWGYDPEIVTRRPICDKCPDGGVDSTLGYSTEPLSKMVRSRKGRK
jgi:hypothetical protein